MSNNRETINPYVVLDSLTIGYRTSRRATHIVARNINATLPAGQLTCLIGRNGAGKSTLLRTIAKLQPKIGGGLTLGGQSVDTLSAHDMALRVSIVLTSTPDMPNSDVAHLVTLGRSPHTNFWGTTRTADLRIVQRSLQLTDTAHLARKRVAELSDGQRQKVMVAKALAQQTPLMLLDEPTAFLDYPSKARLMNLLARLAHDEGMTILLSTNDIEMALRTTDRLWLMRENGSLSEGTVEQMAADGTLNAFAEGLMPIDTIIAERGKRKMPKSLLPLSK